jgi:GTPase SAR1 family protein
MVQSTQNLWEVYGFKENPFNTNALSVHPEVTLSIKNAYINRSSEPEKQINRFYNFFKNPGGGRIVVEGESGVGKTTFVNSFRYEWGYLSKDKLISPATAIQIGENWGPTEFLSSSVFHIISRLRILLGEKKFKKNKKLLEIAAAVGVYREENLGLGIGLQSPIGGISFQRQANISTTIGTIGPDLLYSYLRLLIDISKQLGFKGIILHYDNLETISNSTLTTLINSVRDYLQTPNMYYVFVGEKGMYRKVILPNDRVRSIFVSTPIIVEPFSLNDTYQIIQRRCEICSVASNWILPVDKTLIELLFIIFNGRIRHIMNEIVNLVNDIDSSEVPVTADQALITLQKLKKDDLENFKINQSIKKIFLEAVKIRKFSASELAKISGKSRQYVNEKCIDPLVKHKLIKPVEKKGKAQFFEVESDYLILGIEPMST